MKKSIVVPVALILRSTLSIVQRWRNLTCLTTWWEYKERKTELAADKKKVASFLSVLRFYTHSLMICGLHDAVVARHRSRCIARCCRAAAAAVAAEIHQRAVPVAVQLARPSQFIDRALEDHSTLAEEAEESRIRRAHPVPPRASSTSWRD